MREGGREGQQVTGPPSRPQPTVDEVLLLGRADAGQVRAVHPTVRLGLLPAPSCRKVLVAGALEGVPARAAETEAWAQKGGQLRRENPGAPRGLIPWEGSHHRSLRGRGQRASREGGEGGALVSGTLMPPFARD